MSEHCRICNGNDADVPCAYTTERPAGCLRLKRLGLPVDLSEADVKAIFSAPDDDACHQQTHSIKRRG